MFFFRVGNNFLKFLLIVIWGGGNVNISSR